MDSWFGFYQSQALFQNFIFMYNVCVFAWVFMGTMWTQVPAEARRKHKIP